MAYPMKCYMIFFFFHFTIYVLLLRLCLLSAWLIILVVISCWCLATICCVTVSVFDLVSPLSNIKSNNLIPTFRAKTILSLLNLGLDFSGFFYWEIETFSAQAVSFPFTWQLFDVSRSFWNWRFERRRVWPVRFDICWRGWNIQTQIETVQSHGLDWVSSDFPKIILTQQVKNIFVK